MVAAVDIGLTVGGRLVTGNIGIFLEALPGHSGMIVGDEVRRGNRLRLCLQREDHFGIGVQTCGFAVRYC